MAPNSSNFDSSGFQNELLEQNELTQQEQEELYAEQMREENQRSRLAQVKERAVEATKERAKQYAKTEARVLAKRAGMSIARVALVYCGPVLLGIMGVIIVIIAVIAAMNYACNDTSWRMKGIRAIAYIYTWGESSNMCSMLANANAPSQAPFSGGASGGGGGGASFEKIDIVVTSAYRAGARTASGGLSAHGRGEAIDIALRNPSVGIGSKDPRIAQLVNIARGAGFVPARGDTLDEYTNPAENATGGHIHVEFNLRPDGTTFCDGSVVPAAGPQDLVTLVGVVPIGGASDPRVRPCMLDPVKAIFKAAGVIN